MSRGQMEIFGLVVIVILVALGLLFTIIVLTKEPSREELNVRESVLAANFLSTLLGTSVDSGSVRSLLQSCVLGSASSCDAVSSVSKKILDDTFGVWGLSYVFFVEGASIRIEDGSCLGEREGHSRPEKAGAVNVVVSLHICH